MIEPRLASSVQVSALIRLAQAEGDFATVLRKGDTVAGAIILIGLIRGQNPVMYERFPSLEGGSPWRQVDPSSDIDDNGTQIWQKRCKRDPDLWVVELDVATSERLSRLLEATT